MQNSSAVVRDFFGKEPHRGVNPDEVVAVGAAIQTLTGTRGQSAPVLQPPITDQSFRWR